MGCNVAKGVKEILLRLDIISEFLTMSGKNPK